jgi:MoxR-like ATPase
MSPAKANKPGAPPEVAENLQRPAPEVLYAAELEKLVQQERDAPRPPGWRLSPRAVLNFVLGDAAAGVAPKFVGKRSFVERCIVALATNRGLMLIGEPGTAKSYLSELLAAAISGDSTLTIQGSAGTTEDGIKYTWNYARLLAEGPTEGALVAAPLYTGMRAGKIVRFEEITRCPIEIQDCLLSVLSDRVLHIAELKGDAANVYALQGFNIIATANTLDRGVNEMSAALKRRFNFETVPAIADINLEIELVQRETDRMLRRASIPVSLPPDKTELLVTMFHELRSAKTTGGKALEPLSTVMSTAEGVSVGYAAGIHAYYYGGGKVEAAHLVKNMIGSALKDSVEDLNKLRHYFNHVVKDRKGAGWAELYEARLVLDE